MLFTKARDPHHLALRGQLFSSTPARDARRRYLGMPNLRVLNAAQVRGGSAKSAMVRARAVNQMLRSLRDRARRRD